MCNAYNHPSDCTCGFGGEDHLGGYSFGSIQSTTRASVPASIRTLSSASYDSYINPNATCPVCGASVFFYQSPYGGRVFFDELGPPWPKHACTSEINVELLRPVTESSSHTAKDFGWQKQGWQPLFILEHKWLASYYQLTGRLLGDQSEITLYFIGPPIRMPEFTMLRRRDGGVFEIAQFENSGHSSRLVKYLAFGTVTEFAKWARNNRHSTEQESH